MDILTSQQWIEQLALTLMHFIWQGALIAGLYAVALRWFGQRRSAQYRYLLACSALVAMAAAPLVTLMISAPGEPTPSGRGVIGAIASSDVGTGIDRVVPTTIAAFRSWRDNATTWIVLAWLLGAVVLSIRLAGGWIAASRMRSRHIRRAPREWQFHLDRLRTRLRLARPVQLVISSVVQVPTVVGWLRPVVLVPLGALTGLVPELVEALLAHELAHIRRHDYLVNVLQGVAEALLFYHPAVWWISGKIRAERELCCDDIAVQVCRDPLTYVRALTELEGCRPEHMNPALAANGGSLSTRIARLLGVPRAANRIMLRGPGLAAIGVLIAGGVLMAVHGSAQTPTVAASSLPSFEVASIKPSDADSQLKIDFAAGGKLFVTHATLRFLIKIAYDVTDDQIIGGPAWLSSKRFDVQGKPAIALPGDPQTMTKDQALLFHQPTRLRLQRLLADRFQLELRKDSKDMPIFALVPVKNGPKMRRSTTSGDPDITFGHGILQAKRVDMATLAKFLSEGQVGRPVVDMSGLTDKFDFRLEWSPDPSLGSLPAGNSQASADTGGISVFTALQQQLGMKLDARTSSADTVVVTRAEPPTSN